LVLLEGMKKGLYKLTGIVLMISIVSLILVTLTTYRPFKLIYLCSFFNGCPASMGSGVISFLLFLDYVITLLILAIFLFPGIFYLKIKEEKINKLTNWSVGLALTALIIVILTILLFFILCLPQGGFRSECFVWGAGIFGVFTFIPAGILYMVSILLLIINWFKNIKK